ncbi:hypothetical protein HQ533_03790 [Candidatus Woesearchaeota archaeon]|nr:hypothetical protein [Candidatus Woesearchaeota archaeon]
MDTTILEKIGLSKNESDVYLLLLELGTSLASELAEKSKISRPHVYDILAKLVDKGLAGYVIKNEKRYYRAANPSKLVDFLKEKEIKLQEMLPELLKLAKPKTKKPTVELYEGKEGLKTILNDVVKTKPSEFLDFTSGLTTTVLPYYMNPWQKDRIKANIKARFLFDNTNIGKKRGYEVAKLSKTQVKYMPKDLISPAHIYTYGNKVAVTLWSKEFPFGILIENEEIAMKFKGFFEWFWKLSDK